jgi:hypothetical protein
MGDQDPDDGGDHYDDPGGDRGGAMMAANRALSGG